MIGTLLDCRPEENRIALWIKTSKETSKYYCEYSAKIYLQTEDNKKTLSELAAKGYDCELALVRDLASDELREAVAVSTDHLESLHRFVRKIEKEGNYDYRLYNADLGAEQTFLFEHDLAPLCTVEFVSEDGFIHSIKKIGDLEIKLVSSSIVVSTEYDPLKDYGCAATKIIFDEHSIIGSETEILLRFKQLFEQKDPDIVLIEHGDKFAVEYLLHRFRINRIPFSFSREKQEFERRDGKSYFSYGHIVRREPAHYFKGRYHIDSSGFMFDESSLDGIFHLARIGCMPVQKVARLSPGAVITNLYIQTAYKKGYIIPYKINMVEDFKTARTLFNADKGGFIYEPVTGFHTNASEIDFVSLYPHIMVNYNISPETILCDCCKEKNSVPYSGYHICEKRKGLVPEVIAPLIKERIELKKRYKETGDPRYKSMASALKWVLVTSFGYTGYKRSRFGRIEAHESITSYARHILIRSAHIAEEMGFEVLHGIVDSLWVKKDDITEGDVSKLTSRIEAEFNIPVSIEGIYRWIVFNPSVNSPIAPVPNRYYGVFKDSVIKVRGIELRRRDAPNIVKKFQEEVLQALASAETEQQFLDRIPACLRILQTYKHKLMNKEVEWDDLAIRKHITRERDDYHSSTVQKIVLTKLAKIGINKQPGESIEYIITDSKAANPENRYTPKQIRGEYDPNKYYELLIKALESLLTGFGYTESKIKEEAKGTVQTKLEF